MPTGLCFGDGILMKKEEFFVGPPRIKGANVEHRRSRCGNRRSALLERFGDLSFESDIEPEGLSVQLNGARSLETRAISLDTELGGLTDDLLLLFLEQSRRIGGERPVGGQRVGGDRCFRGDGKLNRAGGGGGDDDDALVSHPLAILGEKVCTGLDTQNRRYIIRFLALKGYLLLSKVGGREAVDSHC